MHSKSGVPWCEVQLLRRTKVKYKKTSKTLTSLLTTYCFPYDGGKTYEDTCLQRRFGVPSYEVLTCEAFRFCCTKLGCRLIGVCCIQVLFNFWHLSCSWWFGSMIISCIQFSNDNVECNMFGNMLI